MEEMYIELYNLLVLDLILCMMDFICNFSKKKLSLLIRGRYNKSFFRFSFNKCNENYTRSCYNLPITDYTKVSNQKYLNF